MATIQKRTNPAGETSFHVRVRMRGQPTQTSTFQRLTDARVWASSIESAIRENRHFKTNSSKKHTLADLIDRYLGQLKERSPKRYQDVKAQLRWWREQLGYCILSDLTKSIIAEKRDYLLSNSQFPNGNGRPTQRKRGPATVNRYMGSLHHAFSVAVNEWEWLEQHPMRKLGKLREPRGRVRYLSDDERARFLEICRQSNSTNLYTIVVMALSTGARRSEIMYLRWRDVDFARQMITLHETKNGERRALPLTGLAYQLIRQRCDDLQPDKNAFVFEGEVSGEPANIQSSWNTAVALARLDDFRFHDLRHSAASYLAMNGASLAEIAEVLGHKTLSMVKRYAHLSEAHTSQVVQRMNQKIFG